jgi:hypothetical protein
MAAPNMASITSITGSTDVVALSTTSATTVTANGVSSGDVYKINTLIVSNVDGVNAATIDISIQRSATDYHIAKTVEVAADSSLVVISRETPIYLEEGDTIRATASAANDLEVVCSYEIID